MSITLRPIIEINPPTPPTATVIVLHGLGADGHDLEPIVAELGLPARHGIRFIFPHAPQRAVTINNGYVMSAWYDIVTPDFVRREDAGGIRESERLVSGLIQKEIDNGIAANRIVLAGFSQGGAIALHTGLRYAQRLAGVIALSSYVPLADTLAAEAHAANRGLPIFMAHGVQDGIIPLSYAMSARDILQNLGYPVTWHTYAMPHTISVAELRDLSNWLTRVLA